VTTKDEPKTLGLVAGLGMGAGIFYYRSLVQAHLDRGLSPRIVMVHADVHRVMGLAQARDTQNLAEYLAALLRQLAGAGADVATIPAFSPQVCAEELEPLTPLPLIGLLDAIVAEIERRKLRRLAIFGARVTMETELFGRLRGVAEVAPLPPDEIDRVGEAYRKIVETEQASQQEFEALRSLAHRMVERERVDAILFAGTDLSFVFRPENTDFPHLDGARTHIEAIMRELAGARPSIPDTRTSHFIDPCL
jgi:aspartate racemase